DSFNEPEKIVKWAKRAGIGGIAVVDHGTIKGGEIVARLNRDDEFVVITGAEIKTDRGEVMGYFLNEEIRSRAFMEVVDKMREQDAIISMPHPFDPFRFNRLREPEALVDYVDAVEVFNSRCLFDSSNKKALDFSKKHDLGVTAGSDAHSFSEIGSSGIIIKGERIREEMVNNREYFGKKNPLLAHAKTSLQRLFPKRL
ncbi:MAG: PHP domain-containing protein, partial [Candidatus Hydrothermarchaeales archaeon]